MQISYVVFVLIVFTFSSYANVFGADTSGFGADTPGFGADTPGGDGLSVYRVTNLNDSGAGSLRDALSQGHRDIKFDVSGVIRLKSPIQVRGPYITVDGASAPGHGISLVNAGLRINGENSAHDVIVRHIRIRDITIDNTDGITIWNGAYNILIDHVSISQATDGALDITEGSHHVTVSNSLLAETLNEGLAMLVSYSAQRISIHQNAFIGNQQRLPRISPCVEGSYRASFDCNDGITVDFRNNLIADYVSAATWVSDGGNANIVNNFYTAPDNTSFKQTYRAITVDDDTQAKAYVAGNLSGDPVTGDINRASVTSPLAQPLDHAAVATQDACTAAHAILQHAGAFPRDSADLNYLASVDVDCVPPDGGDHEPPTTPEIIQAAALSPTQIEIQWRHASDNVGVAYYEVLRDGTSIARESSTQFIDTGLLSGTTYTYHVRAVDHADNRSELSADVWITAPTDQRNPEVSWISPRSGAGVKRRSVELLTVEARDDTFIDQVKFYVNGRLLCSRSRESSDVYSCSWKVGRKINRAYTLKAVAIDSVGKRTQKKIKVYKSRLHLTDSESGNC